VEKAELRAREPTIGCGVTIWVLLIAKREQAE
jgi:hypothetical protein